MEKYLYVGLVLCLSIAGVVSLFASPEPDGLERVAEDTGFIEHGEGAPVLESPFPDYVVPSVPDEIAGASAAGVIGVLITFLISFIFGKALSKGR